MFHYIKDFHLDLFPKSDHDNKHEDAITKVDFLEIPTFKSCFSLFFLSFTFTCFLKTTLEKLYLSNFYISCIFQNEFKKMFFRNRRQLPCCFQGLDFHHIFFPSVTNHALPQQKVIKENCIQKNSLWQSLSCEPEVPYHDVVWIFSSYSQYCVFPISWTSSCLHSFKDSWRESHFFVHMNVSQIFQMAWMIHFINHWN